MDLSEVPDGDKLEGGGVSGVRIGGRMGRRRQKHFKAFD